MLPVSRATGTEQLTASRAGVRYGTATPKQRSPSVFSSRSTAYPCSRTSASSSMSCSRSVTVCSVTASNRRGSSPRTSASVCVASSALPSAVECTGSRRPTRVKGRR